MTLSIKQKALVQTIGMFALAIATACGLTFIIQNVSMHVIANALGLGAFAFLGYMFYCVTLSRLEYQESLKKINEKD